MHLLVETAIGDSQEYEVLSFEEIDELKKELSLLSNRIDASRRKLALESKVRDAAASLSRLYGKKGDSTDGSPRRHRRSFMGSRGSGGEILEKTDDELAVSTRKCEELAEDLWRLEKRATEIHKRILQHTAGILQMTHRTVFKKNNSDQLRPGSPESMYTSSRSSAVPLNSDYEWDERSQYRVMDRMDEFLDGHSQLPGHSGSHGSDMQVMLVTEKKLRDLNNKLRGLIIETNPQEHNNYQHPPQHGPNGLAPQGAPPLQDQLNYLEKGLEVVERNLPRISSGGNTVNAQEWESVLVGLWNALQTAEEDARHRKTQKHQARAANPNQADADSDLSPDEDFIPNESFSLHAFSAKVQWLSRRVTSLKEQKSILRRQIKQQRLLNNKSDTERETEVENLKARLRDTDAEATKAREEVSIVMDRLDNAQRELGIHEQRRGEGADLAAELQLKREEISRIQGELSGLRNETVTAAANAQSRIQRLDDELRSVREKERTATAQEAEMKHLLDDKELERAELEGQVVRLQTEVTIARAELEGAYGTRAQRAAEVAANVGQKELDELGQKNKSLTDEIAALKLANETSKSNTEQMQTRMQTLEKELRETITEYEILTKQSIDFEKEREAMEQSIDGLRDKCEGLETQLTDEKMKSLGVRSGKEGGAGESTSTMVLRNEFKKMMKDTRAENMKALKVSTNVSILLVWCLI